MKSYGFAPRHGTARDIKTHGNDDICRRDGALYAVDVLGIFQ